MVATRSVSSLEEGKHSEKDGDVRIEHSVDLADLPDIDAGKTPEERAAIVSHELQSSR